MVLFVNELISLLICDCREGSNCLSSRKVGDRVGNEHLRVVDWEMFRFGFLGELG